MSAKRAEQRKRRQTRPNLRAVDHYDYVRCKVLRHSFEPVGPIAGHRRPRRSFGTLVTFRCEYCGGLRFDVLSRLTGDLLSRWYEMPDGYRTDRMPMTYWRVALMDDLDNSYMENLEEDE